MKQNNRKKIETNAKLAVGNYATWESNVNVD